MSTMSRHRSARAVVPLLAGAGVLAVPASASAAVETFYRFEAVASATYTIDENCADGSTAQTRVTVLGGHEEEAESGVSTLDSDYLTVTVSGQTCTGESVFLRASGPADFSFAPSLRTARSVGTVTTSNGQTITVSMTWRGIGAKETTKNTTTFPGFIGRFTGQRRDAVASGTVVVDGVTVVSGRTTSARIETLEDRNITQS